MENNRDSKFLLGFIFGAIIGAGVVFLFGTKRGKKILKTISEEGLEGLPDLMEKLQNSEENFISEKEEEKTKKELNHEVKEESKKPLVRRFFKKIAR